MHANIKTVLAGAAAALSALGLLYAGRQVLADGIPARDPLYYSGYLTESGTPVDGTRRITVNLWSLAEPRAGESALCSSNIDATSVVQGHFRIPLDAACKAAVSANPESYVEVIVDGQTSLGRTKIGAVPYAVESERAQEARHSASADSAQTASGTLANQLVPSGAVLAFDLDDCPAGWSAYPAAGGRALIGVNNQYARGATPGEAAHTLTIGELPEHAHTVPVFTPTGEIANNGQVDLRVHGGQQVPSAYGTSSPSGTSGGGMPFNNLQPSLALLYCRKD